MLPSIMKYLTVKLTDNLISQSSTLGKSLFCKPELAILQVSVHPSLKSGHCNHMTRKVHTKTAPLRENPLTHSKSKEMQVNMAAEAV